MRDRNADSIRRLFPGILLLFFVGCAVHRGQAGDAHGRGPAGRTEGVATTQAPLGGAAPHVNVTLSPGGRTTATDTSGRFVFESVQAGHYGLQELLVAAVHGGSRRQASRNLKGSRNARPGHEGAGDAARRFAGTAGLQAVTGRAGHWNFAGHAVLAACVI
jgi:hypothetical protein